MAIPVFVAEAGSQSASTTSASVTIPAHTSGDRLDVLIGSTHASASPARAIDTPAGWTKGKDVEAGGTTAVRLTHFWREGDGVISSVAITFGGQTIGFGASCVAHSGAATDAVDIDGSTVQETGVDITAPSVTTTADDVAIIHAYVFDDDLSTEADCDSDPGFNGTLRGFEKIALPGNGLAMAVSTASQASAGASASCKWSTNGDSDAGCAITLAFAPAPVTDPPATSTLQVDLNNDGDFGDAGEDVTAAVDLRRAKIKTVRGMDVTQKLMGARAGKMTFTLLNEDGTFDVGSALSEHDPARWRALFNGITSNLMQGRITKIDRNPGKVSKVVPVTVRGPLEVLVGKTGYSTQLHEDIDVDAALAFLFAEAGLSASDYTLDDSDVVLDLWWLDPSMDLFQEAQRLANTDGGRLYEDAGKIIFEARGARAANSRSTSIQTTLRGSGAEPLISKLVGYDKGTKRIFNRVVLEQRTRGSASVSAPLFIASQGVAGAGTSGGWTFANPGVEENDVMIVMGVINPVSDDPTVTAPSGWTLIDDQSVGDIHVRFYWKRATDSEPGTWAWTTPANQYDYAAAILVYRGCIESGNPWDGYNVDTFLNDASPAIGTITTRGDNRRVLTMFGSAANVLTEPSGQTQREDSSAQGGTAEEVVADEVQVSAGSTGNKEATGGQGTTDTVGLLMALAPPQAEVWANGGDIVLGNDEVITIVARSSSGDPFTSAVAPVEDSDFTISAGALASGPTLNRPSGSSVEITMTAGPAGCTIQGPPGDTAKGMRLRADLLTVISRKSVISEDATSQAAYETRGLPTYPIRHEISFSTMQSLADYLITERKDPRQLVGVRVVGNGDAARLTPSLTRQISDRMRFIEARDGIDFNGGLEAVEHELSAAAHIVTTFWIQEVV